MSEWIKCSERMPPNGEEVLIWDDGEYLLGESTGSVNTYNFGIFWTYDKQEGFSVKSYVEHWQPLPMPPQG